MRYNEDRRCNEYLLAGIKDTQQASDMSEHSPVIGHYFRIRSDMKDGVFDYDEKLNKSGIYKKIDDMIFNAAVKMGSRDVEKYNKALVIQLAACNFRCPFCYVDDNNLDPNRADGVGWFSAREIVKTLSELRSKHQLNRLRISGGEPGLVPELWLEILEEIRNRGLSEEVYVYADTNLSNYYLTEFLMSDVNSRVLDRDLFKKMALFNNFGVWASLKGNDTNTFLESTGLSLDRQGLMLTRLRMLEWLISDGLDVYINLYNFNPEKTIDFWEQRIDKLSEVFAVKTWLQPIKIYSVVRSRVENIAAHPDNYEELLQWRFQKNIVLIDGFLQNKFGVGYRQIPRYKNKV